MVSLCPLRARFCQSRASLLYPNHQHQQLQIPESSQYFVSGQIDCFVLIPRAVPVTPGHLLLHSSMHFGQYHFEIKSSSNQS